MPEGRKLSTAPQAFTCRMEALLATPITDEDTGSAATLEVPLAGQAFKVKAGRQQCLGSA